MQILNERLIFSSGSICVSAVRVVPHSETPSIASASATPSQLTSASSSKSTTKKKRRRKWKPFKGDAHKSYMKEARRRKLRQQEQARKRRASETPSNDSDAVVHDDDNGETEEPSTHAPDDVIAEQAEEIPEDGMFLQVSIEKYIFM